MKKATVSFRTMFSVATGIYIVYDRSHCFTTAGDYAAWDVWFATPGEIPPMRIDPLTNALLQIDFPHEFFVREIDGDIVVSPPKTKGGLSESELRYWAAKVAKEMFEDKTVKCEFEIPD